MPSHQQASTSTDFNAAFLRSRSHFFLQNTSHQTYRCTVQSKVPANYQVTYFVSRVHLFIFPYIFILCVYCLFILLSKRYYPFANILFVQTMKKYISLDNFKANAMVVPQVDPMTLPSTCLQFVIH
jgi:hypothetical protein